MHAMSVGRVEPHHASPPMWSSSPDHAGTLENLQKTMTTCAQIDFPFEYIVFFQTIIVNNVVVDYCPPLPTSADFVTSFNVMYQSSYSQCNGRLVGHEDELF